MSRSRDALWATLRSAGLAEGDSPAPRPPDSPWYVKGLLAFSGWLAALFLLGFVGIAFSLVVENRAVALLVGALMIAGALALLRILRNDFVEHLGLAVSLAGQALVVYGLFELSGEDGRVFWLLVSALQGALALIAASFVHRVFSALAGALSLHIALVLFGWPDGAGALTLLLAAGCWLHEFHFPSEIRRVRAIGYGLVLALIQIKGMGLFGHQTLGWESSRPMAAWLPPWIGEVLTAAVALFVVWRLLERQGHRLSDPAAIATLLGAVFVGLVSLEVQGFAVGIVILLLGFAAANRVLLGLGLAALLFHTSAYYYLLSATLLAKSQTLIGCGLVLLSLRWLLRRTFPLNPEVDHA